MRLLNVALILGGIAAVGQALAWQRRQRTRETLVTQSGEPITTEALMADSGRSISPQTP